MLPPWYLRKASESSGKSLHFGKIPICFCQNLANIQQQSGKTCKFLSKSANISAIFYESFEIRERLLFSPFFGVVLARSFFPHFSIMDSKTVQRRALCRSRRELSNEHFLGKFGFDTAENEPCKVCPLSVHGSPRSSWALHWITHGRDRYTRACR